MFEVFRIKVLHSVLMRYFYLPFLELFALIANFPCGYLLLQEILPPHKVYLPVRTHDRFAAFVLLGSSLDGDIGPKIRPQIRKRKKHYCLFCMSLQTHLVRHLCIKHRNEPLVKEALESGKKSFQFKKKDEIMAHLRKQGDLCYNKADSTEPESIIAIYNSLSTTIVRLVCPMCGGYYSKHHLSNHVNLRCPMKGDENLANIIRASKVAGIRVFKMASPKLVESILPTIRDTKIMKVAAQDETIVLYANRLIDGYYREGAQEASNQYFNFIASKIRLMAKLLIAIREIDHNINLKVVFVRKNYYTVVKAIKVLGGYRDGLFRAPSTASACCTIIGHVASSLRVEAVMQDNQAEAKIVDNFMLLMRDRQNIDITKLANDTRAAGQRSRNLTLPTTREIKEFITKLMNELESTFVRLGEAFDPKTYHKMSQLCLVYVMVFNRKRPGD